MIFILFASVQNCKESLIHHITIFRGLAAFFSTHGSDGIYGDAAFPSISPNSMKDSEEIFTHRLKYVTL